MNEGMAVAVRSDLVPAGPDFPDDPRIALRGPTQDEEGRPGPVRFTEMEKPDDVGFQPVIAFRIPGGANRPVIRLPPFLDIKSQQVTHS